VPATVVFFFKDEDGSVPVLDWLESIRQRNERAFKKCFGLIRLLEEFGVAKTKQASEILKRKTGIDPDTDPEMLQIAEDYRVAQMIYDARSARGMTQTELAKAVGTTQSVISQLEDADYEGHSLSMLRRIAKALHHRVEIRIVPDKEERPSLQKQLQ
jgi:ribosome-binding protein aMBF1 (putative translation factor)